MRSAPLRYSFLFQCFYALPNVFRRFAVAKPEYIKRGFARRHPLMMQIFTVTIFCSAAILIYHQQERILKPLFSVCHRMFPYFIRSLFISKVFSPEFLILDDRFIQFSANNRRCLFISALVFSFLLLLQHHVTPRIPLSAALRNPKITQKPPFLVHVSQLRRVKPRHFICRVCAICQSSGNAAYRSAISSALISLPSGFFGSITTSC